MKLTILKWESKSMDDVKIKKELGKLETLLECICTRGVPEDVIKKINTKIEHVNSNETIPSKKEISKVKKTILEILHADLKWVAPSYYKTLWMSIGMSAFGIPMGIAFSASLGNYGFIGIGLPIGMVIGLAIGQKKDEEAKKNGLQLNVNV